MNRDDEPDYLLVVCSAIAVMGVLLAIVIIIGSIIDTTKAVFG